jgi:hypothetical protein
LWAGTLDINMATRKKHTPEQVVRKLAAADRMLNEGKDVADVCREMQGSEQMWRNQFGGMNADDAKRLKDLERVERDAQAAAGRGGAGEGRTHGDFPGNF